MQTFLARHGSKIKGTLSGLDRVRFRGTLRWLAYLKGMWTWLSRNSVLLKNFKAYAQALTDCVRESVVELARKHGRPVRYLHSSRWSKEEIALEIAAADRITEGLVCVLSCVEPCRTYEVGPNAESKHLELRLVDGKCLHMYVYLIHPEFGWLHVRLQTWLPFTVQVTMNGREWLSRRLQRDGISFEQRDNCFVDVGDMTRAQALLDEQLRTNWASVLDDLVRQVHPAYPKMFGQHTPPYYWSADETELATDILFRSSEELAAIYPQLTRQAITTFNTENVLRFFGRRPVLRRFTGETVHTEYRKRPEGVCLKHHLGRNTLKMYDKQESVLRVETTINDPRSLKSYRAPASDPAGQPRWQPLRKGVGELYRLTDLSQAANRRYLEALASTEHDQPLADMARGVCSRVEHGGRKYRALNPLSEHDAQLLTAVNRGEFKIQGFRNRDLCPLLFGPAATSATERRRQSSKVTRQLTILRAHGLIKRIPRTHRYTLTAHGQRAITAFLAARQASTKKLVQLAA